MAPADTRLLALEEQVGGDKIIGDSRIIVKSIASRKVEATSDFSYMISLNMSDAPDMCKYVFEVFPYVPHVGGSERLRTRAALHVLLGRDCVAQSMCVSRSSIRPPLLSFGELSKHISSAGTSGFLNLLILFPRSGFLALLAFLAF